MFNVKWDEEINGILLTDDSTDLTSPRPVFYEELDLLGFDDFWDYPKSKNPLLWAIGRKYYYKGKLVATAKKGNILNLPDIVIEKNYLDLKLEEIDINAIINHNLDELFVIENEAMDFIENSYKTYKMYPFSVSFSGGKDSQAVLDLITRVIHPNHLTIIFSDTTLEHDFTYSTVEKTIKKYKKEYPKIKFKMAKPPKNSDILINELGLPSRFHRWCTPILKTAPYNKLINSLVDNNSKIIVFEGVRAEESSRRSKYKRIADGVKHPSIINARPILYWNYSEVILYNFYRNLPINPLYRYGLTRVGCILCPFSSAWSESIISHIDSSYKLKYVPIIKEYAKNRGLSSEVDLENFVLEGQWKKRAGGIGINSRNSLNFSQSLRSFKAVSIEPTENFLEWIKVLGKLSYTKKENNIVGELNIDNHFISFTIIEKNNKQIIEFYNIQDDVKLQNKIKNIVHKSTFCVNCGVCDIECTQGAIKTKPQVKINSDLCINCGNCINFTRHGCYRAKSIDNGSGGKKMNKKTTGIDKYSTFGLRKVWLEEFLEYGDEWLENNTLGPKQIPAVINWLSEAELIDHKSKKTTNLYADLKEIYAKDPIFVWAVIWINLYYNSKVINWYCDNVEWGTRISKDDLLEQIMDTYDLSKGTLYNAITAMINMFDNSPLGDVLKFGILEKKGNAVKYINKNGDIPNLDRYVVAYSLYKTAFNMSRNDFTVSELYDESFKGGPFKLFGVSQSNLEVILRGLQHSTKHIISIDLALDLDNIFLDENIDINDIIQLKKEELL